MNGLILAVAVSLGGIGADSPDPLVQCRGAVVELRAGQDDFHLPWDKNGRLGYENGLLHLKTRSSEAHLRYQSYPGPKPFPGPLAVRIRTSVAYDGEVEVFLRQRDGKRVVSAKAEWRDSTVVRFDLPSSEYWVFERLSFRPRKTVDFDFDILSVEFVTLEPPAAAIRLDVDTGNPLHLAVDSGEVHAVLRNAAREEVSFDGVLHVSGYFGDKLDIPVAKTLGGGQSIRIPIDVSAARPLGARHSHGLWKVSAELKSQGTTACPETRFAILNDNPKTPRLPLGKFRFGINYHMARFSDVDRKLTLDLLNACGVKLVRVVGGFSAERFWKAPETVDFSLSDRLMRELKDRGLSLNTSCWPYPDWASPEKVRGDYQARLRSPILPGYAEKGAELLATHFGRDIDYIETSNEMDLCPRRPGYWTAEDYVAYQKDCYRGIKRGCKDIRVLPTAFAVADSSHVMVSQKGFQETVLERAKGFYDVHPTHQHSGFAVYENDVLTKFFPMRKRLGVSVPWYANETAMTTVNGAEDGVALAVWMKMLFSWAHGSTDYIWYNLKATGWCPNDSEQGFGLVTADYYPRAGFASFSALAHILTGFDFDGIQKEGKGRHLYRFRSPPGCRAAFVFAGWDGFTDPPFPIRIRTDARRAKVVDLMGNAVSAERCEGGFLFPISRIPGAIILDDATVAEPNAEDADRIPPPKVDARQCAARIEGRSPDFVLDRVWKVHELYAGNPETVNRLWKGPEDLSAKVWIGREDDDIRVRFVVVDDRHVQHSPAERLYMNDGLQFIFEAPGQNGNFEFGVAMTGKGEPLVETWAVPLGFFADKVRSSMRLQASRNGNETIYDVRIPMKAIGFDEAIVKNGFRFNCIIYDDDGIGESRDNWIEIVPGIAFLKEYSHAPFVRIQ